MFPATTTRVEKHTDPEINARIGRQTEQNVRNYGLAGPDAIALRLEELDREWDIERAIEAQSSSLMLAGLALGTLVDRRFLLLPAAVAGFLLLHATQGWCPPIPVLRRLGFRTPAEIARERYALKALRGDFLHAALS